MIALRKQTAKPTKTHTNTNCTAYYNYNYLLLLTGANYFLCRKDTAYQETTTILFYSTTILFFRGANTPTSHWQTPLRFDYQLLLLPATRWGPRVCAGWTPTSPTGTGTILWPPDAAGDLQGLPSGRVRSTRTPTAKANSLKHRPLCTHPSLLTSGV